MLSFLFIKISFLFYFDFIKINYKFNLYDINKFNSILIKNKNNL